MPALPPPPPVISVPQCPRQPAAVHRRRPAVRRLKELFDRIRGEIAKIYVGQEELVLGTLVALFSGGHVLIESVPGLGKTLFVRALGRVLGCRFGRIQFTADLMPSDITGAPIFDMKSRSFASAPARCSRSFSWPTRSTARRPRRTPRCWRSCRNTASRSTA